MIEENKFSILRKVNSHENYYLNNTNSTKSLLYTLCIESDINLNEKRDLIDKSIYEWKLMHPFLRCFAMNKQIEKTDEIETYFVYADETKIINSFENGEFLTFDASEILEKYKINKDDLFEETWKLVAEKELNSKINLFNGDLLWRLKFFSLTDKDFKNSENFKYCVILAINHSICDGKSSYKTLMHLFQIIENIYLNKFERQTPYKIFPGKGFYQYDFINENQCEFFKIPIIKYPTFFKQTSNLNSEFGANFKFFEKFNDKKIFKNNSKIYEYSSIRDLLEISNKNYSKFITINLDEFKSQRLIAKCKKYECKVNSCLISVFSLAMRLTHLKYGSQLDIVTINIPVDIRDYFIKKYGNENFQSISLFVNGFLTKFEENFECFEYLSEKWLECVWLCTKKYNDLFHEHLINKEFLKKMNLNFKNLNDMQYHFLLNNYGVLQESTEYNSIKIFKQNTLCYVEKNNRYSPWSIIVNSLNNKIYITIRYNASYIDKYIVNSFFEYANEIFDKLI